MLKIPGKMPQNGKPEKWETAFWLKEKDTQHSKQPDTQHSKQPPMLRRSHVSTGYQPYSSKGEKSDDELVPEELRTVSGSSGKNDLIPGIPKTVDSKSWVQN
eukprot:217133-Amphidinium_carterae.1